ncbi:rhomboid family intramembrane serine protease [Clostridium sp. D53t1_180928_C8]|uniref:rhomboid family intramembrane serine protease n=1 Tax=Clostridium sp. D53t1_180928_C8 TaxID=2787101 RepID=UPI0018AC617A|nr:rhomboid family intramembrane serine protease [Clostridium sp. D53t1_180928_C8]
MNKLEDVLFGQLTKQGEFYIKDYYSDFLKEKKWIAIMESEDFIYAVVVSNSYKSDFIYYEAISFLGKMYSKKISLNMVIYVTDNYESLINQNYNKVIYSEKEKQVVYSDSSCKPLVSILNYSMENKVKEKLKYKESIVTYILICINILIFIVTAFMSKNIQNIDSYTLVQLGAKVNVLIDHGQPWRLITCAFLHGGLAHIAFNMYALKIIGSEVEYVYGKIKYIVIYLISALGGSIFSYLFNSDSISVGASGAIFGLLGAMIIFGIKHKDKVGKGYIINLLKVLLINIFIGVTLSNIDNGAHIGGLIFGGVSALMLKDRKIY